MYKRHLAMLGWEPEDLVRRLPLVALDRKVADLHVGAVEVLLEMPSSKAPCISCTRDMCQMGTYLR